ncbi:MAG: DUF5060 domain-containing protein, partial [Bacteroidota bacterium]
MNPPVIFLNIALIALLVSCEPPTAVDISDAPMQWHKVTVTVDGPQADESDTGVNPFLDYRMTAFFIHESGTLSYNIPGYFAADGNAGETSATAGNKWRVNLSPDRPGRWDYEIKIESGPEIAIADPEAEGELLHFTKGSFEVGETDKRGRDFRAHGRLQYVGERYLKFAGSGKYF